MPMGSAGGKVGGFGMSLFRRAANADVGNVAFVVDEVMTEVHGTLGLRMVGFHLLVRGRTSAAPTSAALAQQHEHNTSAQRGEQKHAKRGVDHRLLCPGPCRLFVDLRPGKPSRRVRPKARPSALSKENPT